MRAMSSTREEALLAHLRARARDRRSVGEDAEHAGLAEVDQRVQERRGADPVRRRSARGSASSIAVSVPPRQRPTMFDLGRAGDLLDRVERGARPVEQVVVERDVAHRLVGVAVADREHGVAVLDRPLDEAPPRREVHDVVLVDPRRAAEQRDLVAPSRSAARTGSARSGRCGTRPCPASPPGPCRS